MTKEELKRARERLGMTQEELATAIGMRQTSIGRMEVGLQRVMRTTELSGKYLLLTMSNKSKGREKGRGRGGVYLPYNVNKTTGEKVYLKEQHIYYNDRGKQIKENTHCTRESDAWKLLRKRLNDIAEGKPTGPAVMRTMFE